MRGWDYPDRLNALFSRSTQAHAAAGTSVYEPSVLAANRHRPHPINDSSCNRVGKQDQHGGHDRVAEIGCRAIKVFGFSNRHSVTKQWKKTIA